MTCFTTIETISQKKRKDSLETRVILFIFSPELEISGVVLQQIHQNSKKKSGYREEWLCENDFETVLATFYCYDYGANDSEAVQKIATDQKDYQKCSSCVKVC